jgi:signal transduction histidine kinase
MDKYLYPNIVKLTLANELDVVLAYKRARQLSELTGMNLPSQTKFATAVSEIGRNVIEHVGEGTIEFFIGEKKGVLYLAALITDRGRGIPDLDDILRVARPDIRTKGCGIVHSRRLVDLFHMESSPAKGTRAQLALKIPARHPVFSKALIESWQEQFRREIQVSPYEEIKQQNMDILDVLEVLRLKNIETDNQLEEIKGLNAHLAQSNQEVYELLAERNATNALLEKMNKELEQFAYTVSHDLRAPLKNIEGLLSLLRKTPAVAEDEKARLYCTMLLEQSQRMDKLIQGILAYARSGRQQVEKTTVQLGRLVQGVVDSLSVPPGMHIHLSDRLPVLEAEEIYLQQVFGNLIGNAIKYHDQPEGNVYVDCQDAGDLYRFSVADDGPGIPDSQHEKVFNMYYTLNDGPARDSTGLGLAIVRKITAEKGGKIWVESEGRGTTFYFTWPK